MDKAKILIVEDDDDIRLITSLYLEKKGFAVHAVENGAEAVEFVTKEEPELVLLDILLPGMKGYEVCKKMREITEKPIIFTSCKRTSEDKIEGLNAGGDDYLTKPYDLAELEARINANLRRSRFGFSRNEKILRVNDLLVDTEKYQVYKNEQEVKLYAKEYQLLLFLMKHKEQVFSAEQIYNQIWGLDMYGDLKTVSVHIRNLRKKIEDKPKEPRYIKTVRGFGYKFSGK
ncbi:response regulator transcription factor [Alkalicoccus daliensis]|uniref:DNA-binding response regulator, OmpR family, contains REC and winged-helix (WHTH) domain n=1 Tax=Alkalicoccus daliensis TaxID=745820 RepID=A0A1H0KQ24_9BACI|nr:response regulator transcription factor [Alkalicoccus daliensis]SDO57896.1 DNA-binding response regulator, OmpR family, contains REC and winged-helix (wHTH) domain [Alkalicoccus daliensis]